MQNSLVQFGDALLSASDAGIPAITTDSLYTNGLNLAYYLAGAIAVIVLVIGGIMYATSAGNEGSVTKAKNLVLYSVVGLVVISIAFVITQFVIGRF